MRPPSDGGLKSKSKSPSVILASRTSKEVPSITLFPCPFAPCTIRVSMLQMEIHKDKCPFNPRSITDLERSQPYLSMVEPPTIHWHCPFTPCSYSFSCKGQDPAFSEFISESEMGKHKQKCPYNPENVPDCPSSPDNSPRIDTVNQQDDHHLAAGAIALDKAMEQTARALVRATAEGTAEATNGVTTEKRAKGTSETMARETVGATAGATALAIAGATAGTTAEVMAGLTAEAMAGAVAGAKMKETAGATSTRERPIPDWKYVDFAGKECFPNFSRHSLINDEACVIPALSPPSYENAIIQHQKLDTSTLLPPNVPVHPKQLPDRHRKKIINKNKFTNQTSNSHNSDDEDSKNIRESIYPIYENVGRNLPIILSGSDSSESGYSGNGSSESDSSSVRPKMAINKTSKLQYGISSSESDVTSRNNASVRPKTRPKTTFIPVNKLQHSQILSQQPPIYENVPNMLRNSSQARTSSSSVEIIISDSEIVRSETVKQLEPEVAQILPQRMRTNVRSPDNHTNVEILDIIWI